MTKSLEVSEAGKEFHRLVERINHGFKTYGYSFDCLDLEIITDYVKELESANGLKCCGNCTYYSPDWLDMDDCNDPEDPKCTDGSKICDSWKLRIGESE